MKIFSLLTIISVLFITGCKQQNVNNKILATPFIDSVIKKSDSSYQKAYYRSDFVTAQYYVNKKNSTVCQLMKDSASKIRQVVIVKNDTRIFFGTYYKNGQLQADLPLDEFGQYHGTGNFYYENGSLQSSGNYTHGFKTGSWTVYDVTGKLTATDNFDNHGNLVSHTQF